MAGGDVRRRQTRWSRRGFIGAASGALLVSSRRGSASDERVLAEVQSPYNHIVVGERGSVRTMYFVSEGRRMIESQIDLERPTTLDLEVFRTMLAGLLVAPAPRRLLMIGVGGGQLSNYLFARIPGLEIDAVDIDPEVIRLAQRFFGVPDDPRYRMHVEDGRLFVERKQPSSRWDHVILDAFRGVSVPRHLRTREFYAACRSRLSTDGVVIANLHRRAPRYPHDRATFQAAFAHCYVFRGVSGRETTLVADARPSAISVYDMRTHARALQPSFDVDLSQLAASYHLSAEPSGTIVTDDFAPGELERGADRHNRGCAPRCVDDP